MIVYVPGFGATWLTASSESPSADCSWPEGPSTVRSRSAPVSPVPPMLT